MGRQFGGEQIHVCGQLSPVAVDLKTITTLLIGYTPIQDKIFKKLTNLSVLNLTGNVSERSQGRLGK